MLALQDSGREFSTVLLLKYLGGFLHAEHLVWSQKHTVYLYQKVSAARNGKAKKVLYNLLYNAQI